VEEAEPVSEAKTCRDSDDEDEEDILKQYR
jgi:hypothetical protein